MFARPALLVLAAALVLGACDSNGPDVAEADSTVTVAYVGTLEDGTVFDQSSRATFSLRQVIPGFRDGIIGMRVGETKTITVPPEQGYGDRQQGPIPPNSTLIFEVELLDIR